MRQQRAAESAENARCRYLSAPRVRRTLQVRRGSGASVRRRHCEAVGVKSTPVWGPTGLHVNPLCPQPYLRWGYLGHIFCGPLSAAAGGQGGWQDQRQESCLVALRVLLEACSWASSVRIDRGLGRNLNSGLHPRPLNQKLWGWAQHPPVVLVPLFRISPLPGYQFQEGMDGPRSWVPPPETMPPPGHGSNWKREAGARVVR